MAFAAAAVGGAALAGLGGAFISASATRDAAQTQAGAAQHAADLQYQMYQQERQDQAPWRAAGAGALSQMQDPYFQQNFSNFDMQQDPGYQFRMDQGMKALQASAAARGSLGSGNTLQALNQFGQDYASNEYQNAYNRFTNNQSNRFNRLASVAGIGQTANAQLGQAGMNYANNASGIIQGAGNAAGAAQIAQGQTWGNALSSLGSQGANTWMQYQMLNRMPNYGNTGSLSSLGSSAPGTAPGGYGGGYGFGGSGMNYDTSNPAAGMSNPGGAN